MKQIHDFTKELIEQGKRVLATKYEGNAWHTVDNQQFFDWVGGGRHLLQMLGAYGKAFSEPFQGTEKYPLSNRFSTATQIQGTLLAIERAITNGLFFRVEDLVLADAFANLLEQAEYLIAQGYFLAAGVLGRAVLEEHLRKLCDHAKCLPQKPKPTINDLVSELYRGQHLNLLQMKQVDAMAIIGNDAAHNKASLTKQNIEQLLHNLNAFLLAHPLAGP